MEKDSRCRYCRDAYHSNGKYDKESEEDADFDGEFVEIEEVETEVTDDEVIIETYHFEDGKRRFSGERDTSPLVVRYLIWLELIQKGLNGLEKIGVDNRKILTFFLTKIRMILKELYILIFGYNYKIYIC